MGLNKPVDFTTAKLLKEKGFDVPKNKMYCKSIPMFEHHHVVKFHDGDKHECSNIPHDWNSTKSPIGSTSYYSAPTIAEVVMWLYEKHGVWITVCVIGVDGFGYWLHDKGRKRLNPDNQGGYWLSPTEAYEAAIKHCLEKII